MSDADSDRTVRMLISGRVQGVGFRYFTQRVAERLGLVGWVKNLPTGEVEVQVRGELSALEAFRQQLRQGPRSSRVDPLSESALTAAGDWSRFEIWEERWKT
jgi:acylphosphatase